MFDKATSKSGSSKKDEGSTTKSRKSSLSNSKSSHLNIVESNGSLFFSKAMLKYMADQ